MIQFNLYTILNLRVGCTEEDIDARYARYKRLNKENEAAASKQILEILEKHYTLLKEVGLDKYNERVMSSSNINEGEDFSFTPSVSNDEVDKYYDKYVGLTYVNKSRLERMKREKRRAVLIKIAAVVLSTSAFFGSIVYGLNKKNKEDLNHNVCVEYEVQPGDTQEQLSKKIKDISVVYPVLDGYGRQNLADKLGISIFDLFVAGDVIIGRTTKDVADDLVDKGLARIISIEEAVDCLGENNALSGEFRAYVNGKSNVVFFVPVQKTMV